MTQPTKWQLQCSELKQRGAYLFRTKLWSDISFQFGTENKVYIKAHKLIMAMASPVFERMFYGGVYENPVPISDIPPDAFDVLLEYIYSDNINIKSFEIACDLYYAAMKCRVPYVAKECARYISHNLGPSNVCRIYEMDGWMEDSPLKDACLELFTAHTKEIIEDDSFLQADINTVVKVFSLETLNIDSELDLFEAAVRYADTQDKSKEREKSWLSEENIFEEENAYDKPVPPKRPKLDVADVASTSPRNSLQENEGIENQNVALYGSESSLGDKTAESSYIRDDHDKLKYRCIVQQIRFRTLTPLEFAECATLLQLLTVAEALALSMNISSNDTPMEMPEGFSKSMVPRNLSTKQDRERPTGTFHSTVPNFKTFKKYESAPFYVRNLPWTVLLLHKLCDGIDSLVVGLTCFFEGELPEWMSNVKVKIKFYSYKPFERKLQKMHLYNRTDSNNPCPEYCAWITKLQWSDITNPDYGLINDNSVTYKVYVVTNEAKHNSLPPTARKCADTSGRPSLIVSLPIRKMGKVLASSLKTFHDYTPSMPIAGGYRPQSPSYI